MKLQNLAIIFIVILIPIILIVSYYLNLQKSTLSLQTSYDQKLVESAKEAIQAFEINTTEWNSIYSNLSDSKRRDVMASINTFISSLSSNLGMGGTATENLLSYIPAIAFTLYDGYYVYAPAYTPIVVTNEDGIVEEIDNLKYEYDEEEGEAGDKEHDGTTTKVRSAKKEYKHTLTTYLPYSKKYGDIVVDYTLDNYIKVYGNVDGETVAKAGNLVYFNNSNSDMTLPNDTVNVEYNNKIIKPEILTEKVMLSTESFGDGKKDTKTYKYIYDIQNEKYYFDDSLLKFFRIVNGEKVYLSEDVTVGDFAAKYRKVAVYIGTKKIDLYQLLNGTSGEWFIDTNDDGTLDERVITGDVRYKKVENLPRYEDCSAINYYVDAYEFTEWVKDKVVGTDLQFLEISETNDPEKESAFAEEKREVIKKCVQETLNTSITQYAKQTDGYQFRLTQLSETDWDQLLRNASITAFFQGVPIGLKYYNNYAIATSTTNKEFINKDEIYFSIER